MPIVVVGSLLKFLVLISGDRKAVIVVGDACLCWSCFCAKEIPCSFTILCNKKSWKVFNSIYCSLHYFVGLVIHKSVSVLLPIILINNAGFFSVTDQSIF